MAVEMGVTCPLDGQALRSLGTISVASSARYNFRSPQGDKSAQIPFRSPPRRGLLGNVESARRASQLVGHDAKLVTITRHAKHGPDEILAEGTKDPGGPDNQVFGLADRTCSSPASFERP